MEKYSQQLSNFTTDDNWCHLLFSLGIPASGVQHNSLKCLCPDVPRVPMCPHLPYMLIYIYNQHLRINIINVVESN